MPKGVTHGLSYEPLYQVWMNMIQRCTNPNFQSYEKYGGRGITVCPEWLDNLPAFLKWARSNSYATGLTLDREKNDQGYSPSNCRWVTRTTQQRNRRSHKGSSSSYVGVGFFKLTGRWKAYIKINGKPVHLGYHDTELEAAKARDQYIVDNNLKDFTMNDVLP